MNLLRKLGIARDLEGDSFEVALRSAAAFVAIALIGLAETLRVPGLDATFLIGSLGASAVIVFGAPESPMARTRAVFGGHFVSGVIGVICFKTFGDVPWLSGALAVSVSIFAMHLTRTMHAPGGATALIANIGSEKVKALGFAYVLSPVLTGALVLMIVALMVRALRARRATRAPEALVFETDEDDALADEFERD